MHQIWVLCHLFLQLVQSLANDLREAQQMVYLGGHGQPERMTDDFGLRELWGK
jgi:hypothetical protein